VLTLCMDTDVLISPIDLFMVICCTLIKSSHLILNYLVNIIDIHVITMGALLETGVFSN
jgi:hypothetical protein